MSEKHPVLIRGTNAREVRYIFGGKSFQNVQRRIHAYVVKEGVEENKVNLGLPVNDKNTFNYIRNQALPWAAWLNRDGRYIGRDISSEDESGGYLIYFNSNALDYYVEQDKFDKREVLSAVKLWLPGLSHFDIDKIVPLLPCGFKNIESVVGRKISEPLFSDRDELLATLFSLDFMGEAFSF